MGDNFKYRLSKKNFLQLKDKSLIELIKRKVKLSQPYVGLFLKKDQENEDETIKDLDEIHSIGTFAQIIEMHDLGDKIRLVVMAHRRIRVTGSIKEESNDLVDKSVDEKILPRRRFSNRGARHRKPIDENVVRNEVADNLILMINNENYVHDKFQQTEELKALTQEVIKTIRDIISINPLYRDSLHHMMNQGQRVVDNPVYLSDLGAALTNADAAELQAVLEEIEIPKRLMLTLSLLKKEYELIKLQQKIGKEVEEKVKQQHRKYILHEQLKVFFF